MSLTLRAVLTFALGLFCTTLFAGHLTVTLAPSQAVSAGAQWRVDGGSWKNSGATVKNLSNTSHTVTFRAVSGWLTPAAATVNITAGNTTLLAATYVRPAALRIDLTPVSGQWRVDGGTWQASGSTVAGLSPGNHTIDYNALSGYAAPASETVSLVADQTTTLNRSYTELAQLSVSLTPNTAQWRVDGGAWRASGTIASNLAIGAHTIDYQTLAGYTAPTSESINLTSGQTLSLSRDYVQLAQVTVTLSPTDGQWRIDGGAWQPSGAVVTNLFPGTHSLEYASLSGYIAPAYETIDLAAGQSLSLPRSYVQLAQLTATLDPSNAQWRVNGGEWQNSSAIVQNLAPGDHTIDYATLTGYLAPPSETVTLVSGQILSLTRAYTPLANLTIQLDPPNAQWRIDSGPWQSTGTVLNNLSLGSHTIDYAPVVDYIAPPSETISLASGANSLTRSYTPAGPAYVIVKDFTDLGQTPSIVRGSDGVFYVATRTGGGYGAGQIFRINADGTGYATVKMFAAFANSTWAPTSLIEGSDGILYGTTFSGGVNTNNGAVFKVNKDGSGYAILHSFTTASTGTIPTSLFEGSDGLLYGTTQFGGMGGYIFRLNKDGTGYGIVGNAYGSKSVIEGPGGMLYATTSAGTLGGTGGSVFRINKAGGGSWVVKHFNSTLEGSAPKSVLLLASDGLFYGTTSAGGTANKGVVYRMNVDGTGFTVLRNFLGDATDGGRLDAPLSEGPDGALYGATYNGGSAGRGTVFRLNKDGSGYTIIRHFLGSATDGGGNNQRIFVAADGTLTGANAFYGGDSLGVLFRMNNDGSGFSTLKSFGAPEGTQVKSIIEASDGALYGVTYFGGGFNNGAVFKVNKDGSGFSVLHRFAGNNGSYPWGHLLEASDGSIYGTTMSGIPGCVLFRIGKDGSGYTVVRTFSGSEPSLLGSGVIEGSDGALYGTSLGGGTAGGYGTVFRINKDGTGLTVLRSFANNSTDGNTPFGRLVEGADGKLYGTNSAGGTANVGNVFSIGKDGTNYTILHQFTGGAMDGAAPYAALLLAADGRLYGTASAGGANNHGTVFGLNLDGSGYATLKHFGGGPNDGATPYYTGLVQKNGVLFGMTSGGGSFEAGTLFSLNPDGSGYTVVLNFGMDDADGRSPSLGFVHASDGMLYGTTHFGGHGGTVFRLRTN